MSKETAEAFKKAVIDRYDRRLHDYYTSDRSEDVSAITPSKDFNVEEYTSYLKYASPEELETDTVKRDTYYGVCMTTSNSNDDPHEEYDYEEDLLINGY